MDFTLVINQILMLFLIILVGYLVRKKNIINEEVAKGLSNLLIDVTIPALFISSFARVELQSEVISNTKAIFLASIFIHLAVIAISTLILRKRDYPRIKKATFSSLLVFGNTGYMGYPVLGAIYPVYGIFYAAIYNIVLNIFIFTYGIHIFSEERKLSQLNLKKFINNGIIGIIIGFVFMLSSLKIPSIIYEALSSLGKMTFPLSMLVIGSSLANLRFSTIFKDRSLYLLVFLKLLAAPLIGLVLLSQFNLSPVIINICVILLAMPSAAKSVIFAQRYGGSHKFASEGVFLTTLASLITIPSIILIIQLLS